MDSGGSLELRIGRLEGQVGAIADKVDGMDEKLDRLVAWTSERKGAAEESARRDRRGEARRRLLLAGGVSGIVSLLVNLIASKFHWTSP